MKNVKFSSQYLQDFITEPLTYQACIQLQYQEHKLNHHVVDETLLSPPRRQFVKPLRAIILSSLFLRSVSSVSGD